MIRNGDLTPAPPRGGLGPMAMRIAWPGERLSPRNQVVVEQLAGLDASWVKARELWPRPAAQVAEREAKAGDGEAWADWGRRMRDHVAVRRAVAAERARLVRSLFWTKA